MSVKIYIPTSKDRNPIFDELSHYSKSKIIFGEMTEDILGCNILLINWPEQLFKWKEPNASQLEYLKHLFTAWKKQAVCVAIIHNLKPHAGFSYAYQELYSIVLENVDAMLHFGKYSLNEYRKKYPNCNHKFINHPIYINSFKVFDKYEARKKLKIPLDKKVLVAPGNIRSLEERKMVVAAFDELKLDKKLLIAPRMYKICSNIEFKGRKRLSRVLDVRAPFEYFLNHGYKKQYRFNYKFIDADKLSLIISAADVVLLPRMEVLNSGNLFLAMGFNKMVVGPRIGNINEILEKYKLPSFIPNNNKSLMAAIYEGFVRKNEMIFTEGELAKYHPKLIAEQWDVFLKSLLDNKVVAE